MIIVDTALAKREAENNPIRVGIVGAGFMARALVNQIENYTNGMKVAAISNRNIAPAENAYQLCGHSQVVTATSQEHLDQAISQDKKVVTEDAFLLCRCEHLDVIVDATGAVEFGCDITLSAIENRKPIVSLNIEMDATVGPLLTSMAKKNRVMFTSVDGDQPGVQMNLYRFAKSIGITPLVCGNIKGLQDRFRNPETQLEFAKATRQKPHNVTSFADGTKISFEQAIVANATGFQVIKRGMSELRYNGHIDGIGEFYEIDTLKKLGGIVDYVVGATPAPGVYVLGTNEDKEQQEYLKYYKMGNGPLYIFYTPYHLCHFEIPLTIARAILFDDPAVQCLDKPVVDVVANAKRSLKVGETIDGIGGFMTYGVCENADITLKHKLLPMGLANGCKLKRDIEVDQTLTYSDIELPKGRKIDELRNMQNEMMIVKALSEKPVDLT